jgi:hypothetical protein
MDITKPRFYWNCEGGEKQTAYEIMAECNGKEICTQKLLDKIHIQLGNETFIPLHIQSFFNYSRAATRFTIEAFQEAKSPVMIWRRASRVNHK